MPDKWKWEVKEIRGIRVDEYGQPFDATVTIKFVNGQANIENLLVKDNADFSKQDHDEIESKVKENGYTHYNMQRSRNGQLDFVRRRVR